MVDRFVELPGEVSCDVGSILEAEERDLADISGLSPLFNGTCEIVDPFFGLLRD
jgi:hypothetical protein